MFRRGDGQGQEAHFHHPPSGPRVGPPGEAQSPCVKPALRRPRRHVSWSLIIFLLATSGVLVRAYRDLSRPEAWDYWKDQYYSPSLTSYVIAKVDLGGGGRSHRALAVTGTIGSAGANWLRDRLDRANLAPGDLVLLSSPGGKLHQAMLMGETIRARGLTTAVGVADAYGHVRPAYCASACVLIYAGGAVRYGVDGSALGVHRFVSPTQDDDPVADTQRVTGTVLGYVTRMGISSTIVEAMSRTGDVRWLTLQQAIAMNLVSDPIARREGPGR